MLVQCFAQSCFIVVLADEEFGSWKLLANERDLMIVSCSGPNCPPCLVSINIYAMFTLWMCKSKQNLIHVLLRKAIVLINQITLIIYTVWGHFSYSFKGCLKVRSHYREKIVQCLQH